MWAAAALWAWSPSALAFGPSGHRVAGHVAERHLCTDTRAALAPLLGGMTLAEAGLWPDMIRRQPEWEHTRPWHFINVSDRGSVARAARRGPDNVLAALARFEKELADRSLPIRQRGIALRFVVHFVVDIHQPLHVGRAEDRGGNLVPVLVDGRKSNLHALWDGEPLRLPGGPGPRDRARSLPGPGPDELDRWQRATPLDWARESLALRRQVYGFSRSADLPAPPAAYLAAARATIDRRLVQAGVRLAGRLDAVLGPPGGCAGEVATGQPNL
ncbi:MAG: S1/P1 nuclease [Chromatiales bacterium]|nr:S1/P1 nuclease [Chromatiales bacterium]